MIVIRLLRLLDLEYFSSRVFKTMELSLQIHSCHFIILLVNYGC